ncbi:MAG: hypothetical protein HGA76_05775 [Candidatus Firestonebacteria bacterium]|nr:hypothetical protein [Candidatus Firestonebacteria bacterium]
MKNITVLIAMLAMLSGLAGCTKRNPAAPADLFRGIPTATPVAASNLTLIDDFETASSPFKNKLGGAWYSFNDSGNGGTSRIFPSPFALTIQNGLGANGSNGYLAVTGTVTTVYANGFIGFGTLLNQVGGTVDLNQFKGIRFSVKGDVKVYSIKIQSSNITDYNYFKIDFPTTTEWTEKNLPFALFAQDPYFGTPNKSLTESLTYATAIQWQTKGQPWSSVQVQIDNIFLYQ